ncbi:hypothetical protein AYO40_05925 [Planctomycetaceae bacterium SCGC AG-212-D15]|nr:hypothetical protein AYO40_05925 [Planctomycetaceae bacterium SCGC AG-212-D15]
MTTDQFQPGELIRSLKSGEGNRLGRVFNRELAGGETYTVEWDDGGAGGGVPASELAPLTPGRVTVAFFEMVVAGSVNISLKQLGNMPGIVAHKVTISAPAGSKIERPSKAMTPAACESWRKSLSELGYDVQRERPL